MGQIFGAIANLINSVAKWIDPDEQLQNYQVVTTYLGFGLGVFIATISLAGVQFNEQALLILSGISGGLMAAGGPGGKNKL